MDVDTEDYKRLVQNFSQESDAYLRQLHLWLGTASAAGTVALATLAANLPAPGFAFQYLLPSFWAFLLGIVAAGLAVFALAMRASARGQHFASAHNREDMNNAIGKIPEVIAAPRSLADRENAGRNRLIARSKREHEEAEKAWAAQTRWNVVWALSLTLSCCGFVAGFAWPLVMTSIGHSVVPPDAVKAAKVK